MPVEPRAWELVLRHIERELLDGGLRPGDHLPPERTLAADLGVGRSSVREAVRVLEGFGLIRTQTGSSQRQLRSVRRDLLHPASYGAGAGSSSSA